MFVRIKTNDSGVYYEVWSKLSVTTVESPECYRCLWPAVHTHFISPWIQTLGLQLGIQNEVTWSQIWWLGGLGSKAAGERWVFNELWIGVWMGSSWTAQLPVCHSSGHWCQMFSLRGLRTRRTGKNSQHSNLQISEETNSTLWSRLLTFFDLWVCGNSQCRLLFGAHVKGIKLLSQKTFIKEM